MNNDTGGGIGFFGAMFLLFLGLKLGNVIDWNWWWVTAPIWGPITLAIIIIIGWIGVKIFKKVLR